MSVETTETQAIDRTRDAHVAAPNRSDANGWAAAFTDDGVQMPPNFPANVGRDDIRAWSRSVPGSFRRKVLAGS